VHVEEAAAAPPRLENTIMKIGNPDAKGPLAPVTTSRTPAGSASKADAAANAAGAEASAKVELSEAAAGLVGQPADAAEFDAAKVARIAQAIAEGKYRINAEVIADKLIANAQELLGKKH
jgi:negative regulator of flagellin synthesis FlgM